jgi:hypothetical protein
VSVETFDVYRYSDGSEYIVTDHGPNVWSKCFLCGAAAACTPLIKAADVRCGQCYLIQFEMLPGQRIYEANAQYAKVHGPSVRRRQVLKERAT